MNIPVKVFSEMTLLDHAQLFTFGRFLAGRSAPTRKVTSAPVTYEVPFDVYLWAKGVTPIPNLTMQTFPG